MRAIDLNVTQGIHGFQAGKTAYLERPDGGRDAHVRLVRAGFRCPGCGQPDVAVYAERERVIAGTDCGFASARSGDEVHPDVAWAKLRALVQGAEIASSRLWRAPVRRAGVG